MSTDDELQRELDAVHGLLERGEISTYEYNVRRRQIREAHAARKASLEASAPAAPAAQAPPAAAAPAAQAPPASAEDELQRELDAIYALLEKNEIDTYEYNRRRREAREAHAARKAAAEAAASAPQGPAAAPPAPPPAAPPPEAPPAAAGDAAAPLPDGWKRGRTLKKWGEGVRSDDPSVRQVHPPTGAGIGSGKCFLFLFGFKRASTIDQKMLERELAEIQDDIEVLRNAGYTVVVDPQATRDEFMDAIAGNAEGAQGLAPAGFYWSAHGHEDGAIECCDGGEVRPADVETAKVQSSLRLAIFGACYVGSRAKAWRTALGGHPLVVGWGRPVTIDRAVEFLRQRDDTDTDLDDLIARYLLTNAPIPDDTSVAHSPLAPPQGRLADLPERIAEIAASLGARYRALKDAVELDVPLAEGRHHVIRLSVIDSAEPFTEGEVLLAAEGDVGELSAVVDPAMLLAGFSKPGYARVALLKGDTEAPRLVAQGFLPLARVRNVDLAALSFQVASFADELERRIFGGDMR